jgi:RNA polymerase sigma-70 factor (ECF subfamily)
MTTADCPDSVLRAVTGRVAAPALLGEDDAILVARVRAGERAAEELLYRRRVHYIGGMLVRLLGSRADAEDAIQETFVIALEQMPSLRDPRALRPWLAQIAVSQARRKFRRRKLARALGLEVARDDVDFEAFSTGEMTADVRAEISTLAKLLARLPTDQRVAWSLRHIEGQALSEVAELCKCSLATAKRRISQADDWVREHRREGEGQGGRAC